MTDGAGEKRALNNPGNSAPFLILTDVHRVKYLIKTFSVCACVCVSVCVRAHACAPVPHKGQGRLRPYANLLFWFAYVIVVSE